VRRSSAASGALALTTLTTLTTVTTVTTLTTVTFQHHPIVGQQTTGGPSLNNDFPHGRRCAGVGRRS